MAAARSRAIAPDRLDSRDVAHAGVGVWSAAGAFSARAWIAQGVGRWVEATWAMCSRWMVVCALA